MSAKVNIAIAAALLIFAVIYGVGAIRVADGAHVSNESGRSPAVTAHMYGAD